MLQAKCLSCGIRNLKGHETTPKCKMCTSRWGIFEDLFSFTVLECFYQMGFGIGLLKLYDQLKCVKCLRDGLLSCCLVKLVLESMGWTTVPKERMRCVTTCPQSN
eukprot:2114265-Amphidinium_carterae.1